VFLGTHNSNHQSLAFDIMGYAGYSPGANSRMADKLTPLQEALRQLPLEQALETLAIIEKLTRNLVRNPGEAKFRTIKLTNPKIQQVITDVPNAVPLLQEMGWVQQGDSLELPANIRLAHEVHVIGIIEAQDYYKTRAAKEHSRQVRESKELDGDAALLRQQIEADRKEKAAEGPITKGSVAQQMGHNGANITRCSDLGIGQNAGG
jgi:hypothetical protein